MCCVCVCVLLRLYHCKVSKLSFKKNPKTRCPEAQLLRRWPFTALRCGKPAMPHDLKIRVFFSTRTEGDTCEWGERFSEQLTATRMQVAMGIQLEFSDAQHHSLLSEQSTQDFP